MIAQDVEPHPPVITRSGGVVTEWICGVVNPVFSRLNVRNADGCTKTQETALPYVDMMAKNHDTLPVDTISNLTRMFS